MADLSKLKPAFKKDGTTTAGNDIDLHIYIHLDLPFSNDLPSIYIILGNASQISDGAGAVLLMKRSLAMQKGLPILGIFR